MRTQMAGMLAILFLTPFLACGGGPVTTNDRTRTEPASKNVAASPTPQPGASAAPSSSDVIPTYTYEIVSSFPHDTKAYTQGFAFFDGMLYESTGQYGESSLRRVELKKGKVKKKVDVPSKFFAEGMTILKGKIYQLTWQGGRGFIYDLDDLRLESEFAYTGEGWGLTTDGHYLIVSDGTNQLRFIDPTSFRVERTISVFNDKLPLTDLNELEYIHGEIYANIWKSDKIVRLDPQTGRILAWVDLSGLRPPETFENSENVLNGIAYDIDQDRLFVTGKRWPKIFEVRLKKKS